MRQAARVALCWTSRCGRRQDVAAGGRTRCCELQKLPDRRQVAGAVAPKRCEPLHRVAGAAAPRGRSSSRWRYCCGRQEGTVAPSGRRHCANCRAHAPATGAAALGVRSRRDGRQDTRLETLLQAAGAAALAAAARQEPMRAAGPVINGWRLMWPALTWSGKHPQSHHFLGQHGLDGLDLEVHACRVRCCGL